MPSSTYLKVAAGIRQVKSSDGRSIPCNYLDHPRFSLGCELCAGLHYVFFRFAPDQTYSRVYTLRTAINSFLDYAVEYEKKNPKPLHLSSLLQISAEVFHGFDQFIKREKRQKDLPSRLKGVLTTIAQDHDEGMPLLVLPMLDSPEPKSHEPLTEECFNQLTGALKRQIDAIYKKLEFRRAVDAAVPYVLEEVLAPFENIKEREKVIRAWVPEDARSLKSLIVNDHPFIVPHDEFGQVIAQARAIASVRPNPANIVELVYTRYGNYVLISKAAVKLITLEELFELYYPTELDQVAIAIFLQLQLGWNKETVLAIDGDDFEHVLTGALTSSLALITSEKQKSQSNDKPYLSPKTFTAASSKEDKYSAYSLINLARRLSSPLAALPIEGSSGRVFQKFNPLFLCMRPVFAMTHSGNQNGLGSPGRFWSVLSKAPWERGIKTFFDTYEVRENGRRFATAADLEGRLRPTWIRFVRDKKDRPLSLVALQQGHESIATTDVHYDSSGPAKQQRLERLRVELNDIAKLLRERKFKGLIGNRDSSFLDISSFRIFTIPGHDKSLWACTDSFKPDWPGSSSRIPVGAKCSEIPKCLFCSRVCVFEDSLPFLMKRQACIQEQFDGRKESAFESSLTDELEIIEYILSVWGDERALKEAARYLRRHPDILPSDMQSLSILFEDA